jgi:putative ubiquitin-RnfH superfamily antitoxin RatB of RatAB toxin-antitoxin module
MHIMVVYAAPDLQIQGDYAIPGPATVDDVLRLAAEDPRFAAVDLLGSPVGIFGLVVDRARPLSDGDRIEIYRPLAVDPKQARRRRAAKSSTSGRR